MVGCSTGNLLGQALRNIEVNDGVHGDRSVRDISLASLGIPGVSIAGRVGYMSDLPARWRRP